MTQNPFARFARWLGLDRNPLRRRCDRVEAVVRLAAVLGVMVAVVLGVMLAVRTYDDGVKTEAQQRHTRHQVTATLMNEPDSARLSPAGAAVGHVKARWQAPDGRQWEGTIDASTSRHQGDRVRIWTDGHGAPAPRPQQRETTVVSALTAGIGIPLAAATGLALVVAATRGVVQRRAKRAWEAQWTVVEPTWRINGR